MSKEKPKEMRPLDEGIMLINYLGEKGMNDGEIVSLLSCTYALMCATSGITKEQFASLNAKNLENYHHMESCAEFMKKANELENN